MVQLGLAQSTIVALSNVIGSLFPRIPNAGMLYALLEGLNKNGAEAPNAGAGLNTGFIAKDTDGKPLVKIRHYQPDTAETSTVQDCEATKKGYVETQTKLNLYRQTGLLIDWKYLQGLAKEASKVYNSGAMPDGTRFNVGNTAIMEDVRLQVMAKIYKLVADINKDLITKIGTKFGTNVTTGSAAAKNVLMFNADGTKNETGYNKIITDYSFNEYSGTPIVVGGYRMQEFANSMKWGSAAASGFNFAAAAAQNPLLFYMDKNADTVFGANNIAVMAPGAAQLVTFNEYVGPFAGKFGNGDFGSFTLPEFGPNFKFDLHVEEESCPTPQMKIIIGLHFDVYTPENIYAVGDPMAGVNGILKYGVTTAA